MKKTLLQKTIFFCITTTCLMGATALCFIGKNRTKVAPHTFAQQIGKAFHDTESTILQELKKLGISEAALKLECEKNVLLNTHLAPQYKNMPRVSPETEKFVKDILRELPVKQKFVILHDTKMPAEAACNGNVILINEKYFNIHSPLAKKFIITHEVGHTYYRDPFVLYLVLQQLNIADLLKLAAENPNHPACKLSRFTEWRADLWACSLGSEYLKGYEEFTREFNRIIKGAKGGDTHPQPYDRLALAEAMQTRSRSFEATNIHFA